MYEFLYAYVKPKYGEKAKLCYMNTKTYSYFIDEGSEKKKSKGAKKCVIKKP